MYRNAAYCCFAERFGVFPAIPATIPNATAWDVSLTGTADADLVRV